MTIVATARAAALDVCDQPRLSVPISLVPRPQKNIAGADSRFVIFECLRVVDNVIRCVRWVAGLGSRYVEQVLVVTHLCWLLTGVQYQLYSKMGYNSL